MFRSFAFNHLIFSRPEECEPTANIAVNVQPGTDHQGPQDWGLWVKEVTHHESEHNEGENTKGTLASAISQRAGSHRAQTLTHTGSQWFSK